MVGEYLGEAVFGALDGTVTTFAIMAGALGANLTKTSIIILGLANLLADGFSMAASSFLSQRSHNQFVQKELVESLAAIEEADPATIRKLEKIYRHKGFRGQDFIHIYKAIKHDPDSFAQEVLLSEGIDTTYTKPTISGLVSFFSFVIVGCTPILAVFIFPSFGFQAVIIFVALVLFAVGSLRSLLTSVSWYRGGLEVMVAGLTASAIAYFIGSYLESLLT